MAPAFLWFVVAVVLLALALLGADNDGLLLVAGLAGLLLTLLTIALPALPPLLQVLLFVAVVAAGYGLLQRWARSQRDRALSASAPSETAQVISGFEAGGHGRVRWRGQSWAALNLGPEIALPPGTEVSVMGRDGTQLQVLPSASSDLPGRQG